MSYEYNPKSNVVFGNVDLSDYNAFAVYCNIFERPERDISVVSVPGRNGDLIFDNGRYKNVDRIYEIHVVGVENVHNLIRDLVSTVGYQRLEDEYEPNVYMMARIKAKPSVRKFVGNAVMITVTFDRMPQKWDKYERGVNSPSVRYHIKYSGESQHIYAYDALYTTVTNDSDSITKPLINIHAYYYGNETSLSDTRIDIFVSDNEVRTRSDGYMSYDDFYSNQGGEPIYEQMLSIKFEKDEYIHETKMYNIVVDSENKTIYDNDTKENLNKNISDFVAFPEFPNGTKHIFVLLNDYKSANRSSIDVNIREWTL